MLVRTTSDDENIGKTYFFTASINSWKPLLKSDEFKFIVIDSLKHLVNKNLIKLFGYVIMPNHIHIVWKSVAMNGKENPKASFLKYTAHEFKKILKGHSNEQLISFEVDRSNKDFEFWQRDSLSVLLYSREVISQKLTYIHNNPVKEKWNLSLTPELYRFSSAAFYLSGHDEFKIITHIAEDW